MKNLKFTAFALFALMFTALYAVGCGDDATVTPVGPGGATPTITMKVNSLYGFTNDSLDTNGTTVTKTRLRTIHTVTAEGTFFGQPNAFQINAETRDTVANVLVDQDNFYVRYADGKFYQYGLVRLIDSTQPASWDMVADFNLAMGTTVTVGTINTTIGGFAVSTVIKTKVAEATTFTTNNTGQTVKCYRVEISGDASALGFAIGTIYVDYYIGYSDPATNPAGLVRTKVRPVWLKLPAPVNTTIFRSPGVDQKLDYWVIP